MIAYLPCDRAASLLEPFVDDELPMSEQVVVEAHLRWCDVCRARVEDIRLIGTAVRAGSGVRPLEPQVTSALTAMRSEVLARLEAERDQSLAVRCRELVTDVRYLWPAAGATLALLLCVYAATSVSRIARAVSPNSMAALIAVLAEPGSDENPLYLDDDMLAPRGLFVGKALADIPEEEAAFAVAAIVTREGRVSNYEVLPSSDVSADATAVREMVAQSRFAPAQTPDGAVAVNVVWLLTRTTVRGSDKTREVETDPTAALAPPALRPARL